MRNILAAAVIVLTASFASSVVSQEPVKAFQELLAARDCEVGVPDGKWGPRTSAATAVFSAAAGITIERPVTPDLLASLAETSVRCPRPSLIGHFLPADVLARVQAAAPEALAKACPTQPGTMAAIQNATPYEALQGLTSSMSNQAQLPAFVSLNDFAGAISEVSAAAYVRNNNIQKTRLVRAIAKWANAGAYLKTRDCTNGSCPKPWQTERGTDLSAEKDSDSVLERIYPIAFAYYLLLADHDRAALSAEHDAIDKWFGAFAKRLRNTSRNPEIYLGFGMGWQWTNLMYDLVLRGEGPFDSRLKRIENGMDRLMLRDGSLKDRTTRGSRATWYHFAGINEFVVSFEILKANGIVVYPRYEERLHKAVKILLDSLDDPTTIYPWAKQEFRSAGEAANQDFRPNDFRTADHSASWPSIYLLRYPDHPNAERLRKLMSSMAGSGHLRDMGVGIGLGCIYRAAMQS